MLLMRRKNAAYEEKKCYFRRNKMLLDEDRSSNTPELGVATQNWRHHILEISQ